MPKPYDPQIDRLDEELQTLAAAHYRLAYQYTNTYRIMNLATGCVALLLSAVSILLYLYGRVLIYPLLILSATVAILSMWQLFTNSSELAAKHRLAATNYGTLRRKVELLRLNSIDISNENSDHLEDIQANAASIEDEISPLKRRASSSSRAGRRTDVAPFLKTEVTVEAGRRNRANARLAKLLQEK